MSDREDKKLNLGDELADVKSLIAGAEDGGFSLDDILAEYGVKSPPGRSAITLRPSSPEDDGPDLPWPEAPRPRRNRDNVVAFPGGGALPLCRRGRHLLLCGGRPSLGSENRPIQRG